MTLRHSAHQATARSLLDLHYPSPVSNDPFDPGQRRILRLRQGREKSVARRHPWIFSGAIDSEKGPASAAIGDLVDRSGNLLASGFYSEHSQIRLRAISFGEPLTAETISLRIRSALTLRAPLLNKETSAARLIHSEGDSLSGLIVDGYAGVLVAEITSAGLEQVRPLVIETLQNLVSPRAIFFRNDLSARKIERLPLKDEWVGESVDPVEILEHGARFEVGFLGTQKTGFFLDQRENRKLIRDRIAGQTLLNLFAYSGGFGVQASRGGASEVTEVDISAGAIEMARRNHALNPSSATINYEVADAFEYVRRCAREGRSFDWVVCDPPAFAKSRHEVDRAARGYKDVNMGAIRLVRPGGHLATFSCSGHMSLDLFQKVIFSAALDTGRKVSILGRLGAGPDHPVSLYCPEGEYLKGFLLRVE